MIRNALITLSLGALVLASGCAHKPVQVDQSAFMAAKPRSILIVPAVNQSLYVEAPNYVLSSLTVPLANKGYYVFPVNTVKTVLEQEGLYEPEKVREMAPDKLAAMFGADCVLYVTINRWDAQYLVLTTQVNVEMDYRIVDKTGAEIWKAKKHMVYSPQQSRSGNALADLIATAVVAAVTRAAPDYMPLVQQANTHVFYLDPSAIPVGPYTRNTNSGS